MRSTFNVDEFMSQTIDPEGFVLDTKVAFVEPGEYPLEITGLTPRETEIDGRTRKLVEVTYTITDPAMREKMNIDEPRARQTVWLDTEPDGSLSLTKNKNVQLGRLLTATGLNNGKRWSWGSLLHAQVWGRVELPRDEERAVLSDVVAVGARQTDIARKSR